MPKPLPGTPGALGAIPKGLGKFFRDRTDAVGSPDLRSALREALSQSRDLIVPCSPSAADPNCWVNREITDFRTLRPDGRILGIIAGGDPPACFPQALRDSREDAVPLAPDMRPVGDGVREARLKLVASLIGVDFDQLRRRDEIAQRRRRRKLIALVAVYLVTVTVSRLTVT